MFLLALNKLGVKPEEAIMIGDNKFTDIEGANAVGIDTVLLTNKKLTEFKFSQDYEKPNYSIKKIPEILNLLAIH